MGGYRKSLILTTAEAVCSPSSLLGSNELWDTASVAGTPFVAYHNNLWLTIFTCATGFFRVSKGLPFLYHFLREHTSC
jgi:hypothetical protein